MKLISISQPQKLFRMNGVESVDLFVLCTKQYCPLFLFLFLLLLFTSSFFSCICITISSDYFYYIGDQFIEPYGFSGSLPLLFAMLFAIFDLICGK